MKDKIIIWGGKMQDINVGLWSYLTEKLDHLPKSSPIPDMLLLYLQSKICEKKELSIKLERDILTIGNSNLKLKNRKKMVAVFSAFLNSKDYTVNREKLIQTVYMNNKTPSSTSPRQQDCHNHNIVKLLSRARFITQDLVSSIDGLSIEWFAYDPSSKSWSLYRFKNNKNFL